MWQGIFFLIGLVLGLSLFYFLHQEIESIRIPDTDLEDNELFEIEKYARLYIRNLIQVKAVDDNSKLILLTVQNIQSLINQARSFTELKKQLEQRK